MHSSAMDLFVKEITLTPSQHLVLNTPPNLIVTGAAGTGKTMLCILLTEKMKKQNPDAEIQIIIFTKALKKYIEAALKVRSIDAVVNYHYEWDGNYTDYLIIDEAQDFSKSQLISMINRSRVGFILLGDSKQRIFGKEIQGEETVLLEVLSEQLNIPLITLKENIRLSNELLNFLKETHSDIELGNGFHHATKPRIEKFSSPEEELNFLSDYLSNEAKDKSVGIFLRSNQKNKNWTGQPYGIEELCQELQNRGVAELGYKQGSDSSLLSFTPSQKNILTYHSTKGLEFDIVLMPFLSPQHMDTSFDSEIWKTLLYVGISRAKNTAILTYTFSLTEFLVPKTALHYEGLATYPHMIFKFLLEIQPLYSIGNTQKPNGGSLKAELLRKHVEDIKYYSITDEEIDGEIKRFLQMWSQIKLL